MADNLNVNELDFDAVKAELITFLGTQSEFNDYDFTGSGLNVLVDVCAYLIHYVGVQANFALRESFLESAQLRKNVSAIAKELGYFPSQTKAGRASFTITLDLRLEAQPTSITIPKGVTFVSTQQDGSSVTFQTFEESPMVDTGLAAGLAASKIWSATIFVAQGTFGEATWEVTGTDQKYLIEQANVDTDFLTVAVRPTQSSTTQAIWSYGKTLTEVGPSTEAYFLSEYQSGVELYFGNNVIGKQLIDGNVIEAEYLVTEGAASNGLRTFALTTDIDGYPRGDFVLSSIEATTDGADRETEASIKYLAPLSYQRQNRIVTIDDYKVAILEQYSNVKAINAWGGEDAVPPEFGKVFVSVAPAVGDTVSPTTKKSIEEDVLRRFSVVGVTPEIVDPTYLGINLDTTVYYNKDRTTLKPSEISSLASIAIQTYFNESVADYNQSFKYSKLLTAIDGVHPSVTHSLSDVAISKSFTPTGNTPATYELKFYNAVNANSIVSAEWTRTDAKLASLRDDGNGRMDLYLDGTLAASQIGTVTYSTGVIELPGFNPLQLVVGAIAVTAVPTSFDVAIKFNNLARLGINQVQTVAEER